MGNLESVENLGLLTIGVTVLSGALGIAGVRAYATGRAQRQAIVDRLSSTGQITAVGVRRRRFAGVDRRIRRTDLGKKIELRLAATGLDLTAGEFFVSMVAVVVGLWLVGQSLFSAFFGPVFGVIGVWIAFNFLNWQRAKRTEKFINQLPELSRILANATQAGLALRTALGMAADEMPAPAGEELAKVANALAVGHSIEDALGELQERLPSRELVVLVTTLVLSSRAGGSVVGSLRNLTQTLEERKETRREVRTQLSQVNVTAYAVPVMGIGALLLTDKVLPGAIDRMTSTFVGQVIVVVSLGLYALALVVIRRISKIDV